MNGVGMQWPDYMMEMIDLKQIARRAKMHASHAKKLTECIGMEGIPRKSDLIETRETFRRQMSDCVKAMNTIDEWLKKTERYSDDVG